MLLLAPFALIAGLKARRTRVRRGRAEPVAAVAGAWDEVVDVAVDAGTNVPADLTRQETAQLLAAEVWTRQPVAGAANGLLWYVTGAEVPTVVALARRADTATFAPIAPTPDDVARSWADTAALRTELVAGAGVWTRLRRRFSLRSLRRRRRLGR